VEADAFLYAAGRNVHSICENTQVPPGSIERGEHEKVVYAYLGGLTDSAKRGRYKQSLVNGVRLTVCQKSDYLIIVMKHVKACGMKGITDQRFSNGKTCRTQEVREAWNMN
jgi:hypothetical protein